MPTLSRQQLVILVLLTLAWGLNWPVMKLGVTAYPPLTFRALSIWLGLPVLTVGLVVLKVPFRIARKDWGQLLWLAATNMFVWHACIILAVRTLSSGRAAILGYTMPIFSAVIGAALFGAALSRRGTFVHASPPWVQSFADIAALPTSGGASTRAARVAGGSRVSAT